MIGLYLLTACGPDGVPSAGATRFTLHLVPVVPFNESPFEGSDRTELRVEAPGVEAQVYDLGAMASGDTSLATGLGELSEATLTITAWRGSDEVARGVAGPVSVSDGDHELRVLVARLGAVGWLSPLPGTVYRPGFASLGDGRFVAMGGVQPNANGELNRETEEIYTLQLSPPDEALAFEEVGTLPEWVDYNGQSHRGRFGFDLQRITTVGDDLGKLILAGGSAASGLSAPTTVTAGVYLYAPETGEWELLRDRDSLRYPRSGYVSSVNSQGGVVYWGGWGATDSNREVSFIRNAELYDPVNRAFTDLGQDNQLGHVDAAITDLGADGTLICGGGWLGDSDNDGLVDWVASDACARVGLNGSLQDAHDLPEPRVGMAMVTLDDGRVLLAGGADNERSGASQIPAVPNDANSEVAASDAVWLYNPDNDAWSEAGTLALARAGHRMTLLPDGTVLVVGGATGYLMEGIPSTPVSCVEVFDPATGTSRMLDSCTAGDDAGGLAGRAWQPSLASDPTFGILVAGGGAASDAAQDAVSLYVP